VETNEIYVRMTLQCGDNCMSQRKDYVWAGGKVQGGRSNVDDDVRSGQPLTVT